MLMRRKLSRGYLRKLWVLHNWSKHQSAISRKSFSEKSSMKHKTAFETKTPGSGAHIYKDETELHHFKDKDQNKKRSFSLSGTAWFILRAFSKWVSPTSQLILCHLWARMDSKLHHLLVMQTKNLWQRRMMTGLWFAQGTDSLAPLRDKPRSHHLSFSVILHRNTQRNSQSR